MEQLSMTSTQAMADTKFMTAKEKVAVLKAWETFLKYGCQRDHFTKALYDHLMQNCSFIAHYDLGGFYATYFEEGDDTVHFLSQFDRSKGTQSIEYGSTLWLNGDYADINNAMLDIAGKYIPVLVLQFSSKQRDHDLLTARALLAKHDIKAQF